MYPFFRNLATMITIFCNRHRAILSAIVATFYMAFFPYQASAIVGGEEATDGEQPWMVGIVLADEENGYYAQFCGGTLIAERWVLTAAHCTIDDENAPFKADELEILVGRTTLDSNEGRRIGVEHIVRHVGFDLLTYNNDIALLQLSEPVNAERIQLAVPQPTAPQSVQATLPTKRSAARRYSTQSRSTGRYSIQPYSAHLTKAANRATVFGWGLTDDGNGAHTLQKADLPLVDRQRCQDAYTSYGITITDNMRCAGFARGGADSCVGDSGGPLVELTEAGEAIQIGLVSWGLECGGAGLYGVYTDVARYSLWLEFQMSFNR